MPREVMSTLFATVLTTLPLMFTVIVSPLRCTTRSTMLPSVTP